MALINCEECQHPLSNKAKICPNCSAPRRVESKITSISEQKPRKMTTKKEEKSSQPLIYFIIGAVIMFFVAPHITSEKINPDEKYFARVEKINGLYVYINSNPVDAQSYTTLETMQVNDLKKIWNSLGIGKDKFGQVLINMINTGNENLVLSRVIENITKTVREKHLDASAIIINDKLSRCKVIKFN